MRLTKKNLRTLIIINNNNNLLLLLLEEVEHEADKEELAHLQPLEVQEALAQRVLQQVVVPDLDEVDEHGALALALVGDQHPEE